MGDLQDEIGEIRAERERRMAADAERRKYARSLYADADGHPIFRNSFAIYLDVLGTVDRTRRLDLDGLRKDVTDRDGLRWCLHDDDGWLDDQRVLSFTDNIVIGAPVNERRWHAHGDLPFRLSLVRTYQFNIAARGHLIRGGVAEGALYIDDSYATGSALVDAVRIEHEVAVYPRVVLSDTCVQRMWQDVEEGGPVPDRVEDSLVLLDADGRVFVNYLPIAAADEGWLPGTRDRGLALHRDLVARGLRDHADDPRKREKYRWLADYHNFVTVSIVGSDDYTVSEGLTSFERANPRTFRLFGLHGAMTASG